MKYLKQAALVLLFALAAVGIFSVYQYISSRGPVEEESATVLLERIEKVMKLVTVEGNFSEIYDYKHHYFADIWPFRKKALVRVNAKVLVGFDFEKVTINIDEESKTFQITNVPPPEIMSIEHDMDYYNFENGLFNMITNQDITRMGSRAKEFISNKAEESDLFAQAEEQRSELFEVLTLAIAGAGWSLVVEESVPVLQN